MRRREFVTLISGAVLGRPFAVIPIGRQHLGAFLRLGFQGLNLLNALPNDRLEPLVGHVLKFAPTGGFDPLNVESASATRWPSGRVYGFPCVISLP